MLWSSLFKFISRLPRPSKRTLFLIVVVATVTLAISNAISIWFGRIENVNIPSTSSIRTMGVKTFWDANLENEIDEIRWGAVYVGQSKNVSIYIRSVSSVETTFEMITANWTFRSSNNNIVEGPDESSPYVNLMWDYDNSQVSPGEAIRVMLILSIDDSPALTEFLMEEDASYFSFEIIFRGV